MSENETPSVPQAACPPKKKGAARVLWSVVLLSALGGTAYAAFSFWPFDKGAEGDSVEIEALKKRVDILEEHLRQLGQSSVRSVEAAGVDVQQLKEELARKDARGEEAARKLLAAAFAFWDLRDRARSGLSFSPQLSALLASSVNEADLFDVAVNLKPYADGDTPTIEALGTELVEAQKDVPPAQAPGAVLTWADKAREALRPLISIRPLRDPRFDAVEKALAAGNASDALAAFDALPEEIRKSMGAWRSRLDARVQIDAILRTLTAAFTTPPLHKSAP